MFSFLGLRKDSKKATQEKETDGGFVIVGETVAEQSWRIRSISQPSTNVVVQPSSQYATPSSNLGEPRKFAPAVPTEAVPPEAPTTDMAPSASDCLGDVPFTLAPHILAMQAGFPLNSDLLLSRDVNYNLASFHYDFTLENSVLCDM